MHNVNLAFFLAENYTTNQQNPKLIHLYSVDCLRELTEYDLLDLDNPDHKDIIIIDKNGIDRTNKTITVTFKNGVKHDHNKDRAAVILGLGGMADGANRVLYVEDRANVDDAYDVLAHEIGHLLYNWKDLRAQRHLMYYGAPMEGTLIRYRLLEKYYYRGEYEKQWDLVPRLP